MANKVAQFIFDLKDNVTGKLTAIGNAMRGNAKTADESATKVEGANKRQSKSFSDAADNVGLLSKGLLKIGAVAAGVVAAVKGIGAAVTGITTETEAAASLEDVLNRVGSRSNATADQLSALGDSVRKASADTRLSVEDAAKGVEILVNEGASIDDASQQIGTSLKFVQASGLELDAALGGLSDSMGAFGLEANKTAESADTLAAAALKGGTGVNQILEAMVAAGPAAQAAGLSFKTTAGILATLAQSGIEGGKGAKALVTILQQFEDPASKFNAALAGAGIITSDFGDALTKLSAKGVDLTDVFLSLDGKARTALQRLLADGGAALKGMQGELANTAGFAAKLSDAFNDTAKGAFDRFKNSISNLGLGLIEPVLKPLAAAFDSVRDKIELFANSADFKKVQAAIGEFAATAGKNIATFVQSIDFSALSAKLAQFATDDGATFDRIAGSGRVLVSTFEFVAAGISATVAGIKAPLYGLATAVSGALDAVARSFQASIAILPGVPESVRTAVDKTVAALDKTTSEFADKTKQAAVDAVTSAGDMAKAIAGLAKPAQDAATQASNLTAATAKLTDEQQRAATAVQTFTERALAKLPAGLQAIIAPALQTVGALQAHGDAADKAGAATGDLATKTTASAAEIAQAEIRYTAATLVLNEFSKAGTSSGEALDKAKTEYFAARTELQHLRDAADGAAVSQQSLQKAFDALHITSTASLQETAKTYEASMDLIVKAARTGAASQDDVRRAFIATAQAQLAAVDTTDKAARANIEAHIREQAAALNVVDALKDVGLAGQDAGAAVADGADHAAESLSNLANNADAAADSTGRLADSGSAAADSLSNVTRAASDTGFALGDVSQKFLDAAAASGNLDHIEFGKLTAQQQAAQQRIAQLDEQIEGTDQLAQRVK